MIWRFPDRSEYAWVVRPATWVLLVMMLAGGVCPALYGDQVPHEHLFVGGSPPAGWESHAHPNPLDTLLGGQAEPAAGLAVGRAAHALDGLAPARVISVYDGMVVVLSIIALTIAIPFLDCLPRPVRGRKVDFFSLPLHPLVARAPVAPPPRGA